MIVKFEVKDKLVKEISEEIEELYGMVLPRNILESFLKSNVGISYDLTVAGFDTSIRENMVSMLTESLAGRKWPIQAEGEVSLRKFEKALKRGIKKSKIRLTKEFSLVNVIEFWRE